MCILFQTDPSDRSSRSIVQADLNVCIGLKFPGFFQGFSTLIDLLQVLHFILDVCGSHTLRAMCAAIVPRR